ncbi:hypothetical protein PsorP6_015794 [Peronosclerospora sorghi]|uniref:Uncharacterized protein n=1 Tax=Peronosclerospora sorghi TaxID=230839 RepID=A0ACC0WQI8_9STRA|nr:hypothetical protein PsorP6_015794 [Peronosclerospora sorghi]
MAQPAAARRAAAAADQRVESVPSTSSVAPCLEAKTQAHPLHPFVPSTHEHKLPNASDKRIQVSTSPHAAASTAAIAREKVPTIAGQQAADAESSGRAEEEARRRHFALAPPHMEPSQALPPSTPCPAPFRTRSPSVAGRSTTSHDLEQRRHEHLAKLQHTVQRHAALAAHAVQQQSTDEWLRTKWFLETEQRRRVQEPHVDKGKRVTTATATSIADSLLAQQQQVLRQQQMLREMLQKQHHHQQAQRQLQRQLQQGGDPTSPSVPTTMVSTPPASLTTPATPTSDAVKKKLVRNAFAMEMEALARICLRVANARTEGEMRPALEKLTTWLHACTDLALLQLAQRDYRDALARRRPMLMQQERWPLDLQVKAEYITQKMMHMLGTLLLREKSQAVEHHAALKAGAAAAAGPTPCTSSHAAGAVATTGSSPTSLVALVPRKRTMAAIEREYTDVKAQLQAKQVETNQRAKAKREAAKVDAAHAGSTLTSHDTMTAATMVATRPWQVDHVVAVKQPRLEATGLASPLRAARGSQPAAAPLSPRLAQQLYDVDLTLRTSSEPEDKMYLPSKMVAKLMSRALPETQEETHTSNKMKTLVRTLAARDEPVQISDDAVTFMQECVTEFLLYVTSEARDLAVLQNRRTKKGVGLSLTGAHVVESLTTLGFSSHARVLATYHDKVKASQDAAAQRKLARKKRMQEQAGRRAAEDIATTPNERMAMLRAAPSLRLGPVGPATTDIVRAHAATIAVSAPTATLGTPRTNSQ